MKRIALVAEYTATFPPHVATTAALKHSSDALGVEVAATWLSTATISDDLFRDFDAIWVAPGSPYKSMSRTLTCSFAGRRMQLRFVRGSRAAIIYGAESAEEEYYCNFGVNPDKVSLLRGKALAISGCDAEGEIRVIELPDHPFFLGTLFVPQLRSTPANPHPLVSAFVQAVVGAPL
jgi:CTP synthase (UTP-ammonia lyase)